MSTATTLSLNSPSPLYTMQPRFTEAAQPVSEIPKRKPVNKASDLSMIDQVRLSIPLSRFLPLRMLALILALPFAVFPVASWWLIHNEILDPAVPGLMKFLLSIVVLGGLVKSAKSVYRFAMTQVHNDLEAKAVVILLEGILCTAQTHWVSLTALGILVFFNLVANACNIAINAKQNRNPEVSKMVRSKAKAKKGGRR